MWIFCKFVICLYLYNVINKWWLDSISCQIIWHAWQYSTSGHNSANLHPPSYPPVKILFAVTSLAKKIEKIFDGSLVWKLHSFGYILFIISFECLHAARIQIQNCSISDLETSCLPSSSSSSPLRSFKERFHNFVTGTLVNSYYLVRTPGLPWTLIISYGPINVDDIFWLRTWNLHFILGLFDMLTALALWRMRIAL